MNLPNKITLSRIILLPVFLAVGLIAFPYNNFVALVLFILLAVSDFLDGHIARKYNLVTDLGKFLDPIADKLLCTTGLLLLIVGENPIIPHPFGIVCVFLILLRDYAITGLRQIAQLKGVIIPADKLGKIKANFQYVMTVYGFLVGGLKAIDSIADSVAVEYITYVFYGVVAITTLMVIISGISYLVKNANVFSDKKEKVEVSETVGTVEASTQTKETKFSKTTTKKNNTSNKTNNTTNKTNNTTNKTNTNTRKTTTKKNTTKK
jgi:CDP-diacylglycerol--glycerol-3-phosphate 3-phosphatidyltransferase